MSAPDVATLLAAARRHRVPIPAGAWLRVETAGPDFYRLDVDRWATCDWPEPAAGSLRELGRHLARLYLACRGGGAGASGLRSCGFLHAPKACARSCSRSCCRP